MYRCSHLSQHEFSFQVVMLRPCCSLLTSCLLVQVKASQCFTKYKWRSEASSQGGPSIVATQVSQLIIHVVSPGHSRPCPGLVSKACAITCQCKLLIRLHQLESIFAIGTPRQLKMSPLLHDGSMAGNSVDSNFETNLTVTGGPDLYSHILLLHYSTVCCMHDQ